MRPPTDISKIAFAYFAPLARLHRAGSSLLRWLRLRLPFLAGLLLGSLACVYAAMGGISALAAERDAAVKEARTLADWHRERTIRVTLEGSGAQVANLALQAASAVRP